MWFTLSSGLIIGIGVILAFLLISKVAKRDGQNPDDFYDMGLYTLIFGILGARIYYVIFAWKYYKDDLLSIFNIRQGGLAIYGGVIAGTATVIIWSKLKKKNMFEMLDTAFCGVLVGQIMGRWGNFTNREVFGGYTDSLFAMRIPVEDVRSRDITQALYDHIPTGANYIQVHPTFLYESFWNVLIFCIMLWAWPRKKFNGEIILIYLSGYGFGRFFLEGLRIDQLQLGSTGLAVSQVLSAAAFIVAFSLLIFFRIRAVKLGIPVSLELRLNPEDAKNSKKSSKKASKKAAAEEKSAESVDENAPDTENGEKPDEVESGGGEQDPEEPQVEEEATETVSETDKEAPEDAESTEKDDENAPEGSKVEEKAEKPE